MPGYQEEQPFHLIWTSNVFCFKKAATDLQRKIKLPFYKYSNNILFRLMKSALFADEKYTRNVFWSSGTYRPFM
jgi:hypothetical protein